MSISQAYMSGEQKRDLSHFANIVKVALADDIIAKEEKEFLEKIAKRYNISEENFEEVFRHPEQFPSIPYLEKIERIGRLYELVKMVLIDEVTYPKEINLLKKLAIGLGFPISIVDKIIDTSLEIDVLNTDKEDYIAIILKDY